MADHDLSGAAITVATETSSNATLATVYALTAGAAVVAINTLAARLAATGNAAQEQLARLPALAFRGPWVEPRTGMMTRDAALYLDQIRRVLETLSNRQL